LGNRNQGSKIDVTNPYALSYAGYNELFTGRPDHLIWSNRKRKNTNKTIFEHLNRMARFQGKVASIASWDAFPFIFNTDRSQLKVHTGNAYRHEGGVRPDTATFAEARAYLLQHRPRVLHLGLGGTDEAAHRKEYGNYLRQAHLADRIIAHLWQLVQSLPEYRDNTSLIVTTDHGRGNSRHNWHRHGAFVNGSSQTWLALLGKGVRTGGESRQKEQLFSSQIAGTIGSLLQVNSFRSYTIPATMLTLAPAGEQAIPQDFMAGLQQEEVLQSPKK
jgi:arylsulfatase A-like enzyme